MHAQQTDCSVQQYTFLNMNWEGMKCENVNGFLIAVLQIFRKMEIGTISVDDKQDSYVDEMLENSKLST